jgi:hypothetical protein
MINEIETEIKPFGYKKDLVNKYNKSVYFILPMIGKSYKQYPNLINCYLGDNLNCPENNFQAIFINNKDFDKTLLIPNFEKYYQLPDETYMFMYNIPKQYSDDYNHFCNGKYSQFSDKYKKVLTDNKFSDSVMYKILYRTKDRIKYIEDKIGMKLHPDAEVASSPYLELEIYN